MKTQLRKGIDKDISDKLLLKDASTWRILKQLYARYDTDIWITAFWLSIAIDIWRKLS